MRIVVLNHVTLDGVMQSPGRADEDARDGFTWGGWAVPGSDDVMTRVLGERMARGGAGLLFGRRTYEQLLSYWNTVPDSPFTPALNNATKYVASTTLTEPLPWPNSVLLRGDVPEAVAALKTEPGGDLTIMGSGVLISALRSRDLIDEYVLMIYPLLLGEGRRLFADNGRAELHLTDTTITTTGVIIATYERRR